MNITLIAMLIMTSETYLNLTDWLVDNFGIEITDAVIGIFDAVFDLLEIVIPCGDMWNDVFERLFA